MPVREGFAKELEGLPPCFGAGAGVGLGGSSVEERHARAGGLIDGGWPVGRCCYQVTSLRMHYVPPRMPVIAVGEAASSNVVECRAVSLIVSAGDQQYGPVDPLDRDGRASAEGTRPLCRRHPASRPAACELRPQP